MFSRELRNGPGFRTTQIAKVTIDAGQAHYRDADAMRFFAGILERFYYVLVTAQFGTVVRMIAGIGLMGMALTMVGLYGLVSYAVSSRTREIGIRMAVGATHGNVVGMVIRQSMFPVWLGLPLGLALSVVASSVLVGMVPTDEQVTSSIYWLVVPVLVAVNLFAATVPARYAARINPMVVLRAE